VTWSLEIEVQFYILAPLLTLVFRLPSTIIRRIVIGAAIVALPIALHFFFNFDSPYVKWTLIGNLQYFLVGFLLADLFLVDWKRQPTVHYFWDVIGTISWLLLFVVLNMAGPAGLLTSPTLTLFAYIAAFRGPIFRSIFRIPFIVITGGMCYTIYLYHWMCFFVFGFLTMRLYDPTRYHWQNFLIQLVTLVPLTLIACAVLFALLEKPFMRPDWVDRSLRVVDSLKQKMFRRSRGQ
jgi:peptidoglycan/LPS O-acetylase OafA/YrhL